MKKFAIGAAAFLLGFGLIAVLLYTSSFPALKEAVQNSVLVKVVHEGGMCADGKTCSTEEKIFSTGVYPDHESLTSDELKKLTSLIEQSNLDALPVNPEPQCPSFYDGQDISFVYPTKYGETRFTLCQILHSDSDPLLSYTLQIVESH